MKIDNYKRNEFWRTELPQNTISKIRDGLKRLNLSEILNLYKNSEDLWSARLEIPTIRLFSNGKGITEELATVSAYGELIERFSGSMENNLSIAPFRKVYGQLAKLLEKVSCYKYVKGYRWVHQDCLTNSIKAEDILKNHSFLPAQFEYLKYHSELMRHWIPAYSFVQEKEVYVPILFVNWISSTNGLASGNTIEEAIIHGTCEIFERYALITSLSTDETFPNVKLDTINDPTIQRILNYFEENRIKAVVKDLSSLTKHRIPTYSLVTFNTNLPLQHAGFNSVKAGSSFNSIDALTRCFTERMQGTNFDLEAKQSNMDVPKEERFMPLFFKGICPFSLEDYVKGDSVDFRNQKTDGTLEEVNQCIKLSKEYNTDLIFVDHTHPVFEFPTARIIMPGLSDFIKWWNPKKINMDFLGNMNYEEDVYEKELENVLYTFTEKISDIEFMQDKVRRDK